MAYSKTNWVNDVTPLNATNMNHIEQGIFDNSSSIDNIFNTLVDCVSTTDLQNALNDYTTTSELTTLLADKADKTDVYTKTEVDDKLAVIDDRLAWVEEAVIKKDLYETQEATFQGMTAVPAGAMVKAYLDGFKGNSAVVNQRAPSLKGSTTWHGLTITNDGSSIHITGTCDETGAFAFTNTIWGGVNVMVVGHKYLFLVKTTANFTPNGDEYFYQYLTSGGSLYTTGGIIVTATGATTINPEVRLVSGNTYDFYVYWVMFIDLTQAGLTSAEMASVSTAKAALKHKGMDVDSYIPYNTGTLADSRQTKLISNPYNLCDGQLAVGSIGPNGQEIASTDAIRTINFIKVFGGREYKLEFSDAGGNTFGTYFIAEYDKDKNFIVRNAIYSQPIIRTLQSNTRFVRLAAYSTQAVTTAGIKICFHLASANLGYKPYVAPIEYDLTMPWLKSAGSVQDESKAGGEKVGVGDLATMKNSGWSSYGGYLIPFVYAGTKSASEKPNLTCDKYQVVNATYANSSYTDNLPDKSITVIANGDYLYVKDSSLGSIADLTGTLHYPLATPTDFSDPISYPEIFDVQEGGSIEVVGEGCDATTKVYFYVEA